MVTATKTNQKLTVGPAGQRRMVTSEPLTTHHIRWTPRSRSQISKLSKDLVAEIFPIAGDELKSIEIRRLKNGAFAVLKSELDPMDAALNVYALGRDAYGDLASALYAIAVEYDPTRPHALKTT